MGQSPPLSTLQPEKESRGERAPPHTSPGDIFHIRLQTRLPWEGGIQTDGGKKWEGAEQREGLQEKRDEGVLETELGDLGAPRAGRALVSWWASEDENSRCAPLTKPGVRHELCLPSTPLR